MDKTKDTPRVSFSMGVRVPDSILLQEIEGEIVALNLDTELYLGINKSGKEIFEQLSRSATISEAYEALLGKYDIEPEDLRVALSRFIDNLLEHGLIELASPTTQ